MTKTLSMFLAVAVILPLTPLGMVSARAEIDQVQQVLVFPVGDATGARITGLSRLATNKLQAALNELPDAVCTEFDPTSPLVRLAISEGRLLKVYVEAEISDPATAVLIGHILDMDAVILASVDRVRIQEEPRQVTADLRGQYFLVEPNYDLAADEAVADPQARNTISVTGFSQVRAQYRGGDRPLIREALADAGYKFEEYAAGRPPVQAPVQPAKKKWQWLGPALALGLLALLISNKGNEGVYSPTGAAAPTPTGVRVESNAIRLLWNPPPATQLTLLRYQIQRSVNNSAWQYIDQGNADAARVSWPDFDVVAGNSYRYRIRAVYTNQAPSPWAGFDQVSFFTQG